MLEEAVSKLFGPPDLLILSSRARVPEGSPVAWDPVGSQSGVMSLLENWPQTMKTLLLLPSSEQ